MDAVGLIHALLLRVQALVLPIQTLVCSGLEETLTGAIKQELRRTCKRRACASPWRGRDLDEPEADDFEICDLVAVRVPIHRSSGKS